MAEQLEHCPFCGAPATIASDQGNEVYPQTFWAACTECSAKGDPYWGSSTWSHNRKEDDAAKKNAAAWWNRRSPRRHSNKKEPS